MANVLILKSCGFTSNIKSLQFNECSFVSTVQSLQLNKCSFISTVQSLQLSKVGMGIEKAEPAKKSYQVM